MKYVYTQLSTLSKFRKTLNLTSKNLKSIYVKYFTKQFSRLSKQDYRGSDKANTVESYLTQDQVNFNFIRRERLYTKLKYSRCPQYDIVSGGLAALLSAFIGFLISEKFGIELVDSGDFYTAFMYIVFLTFSVRPLLRVTSSSEFSLNP